MADYTSSHSGAVVDAAVTKATKLATIVAGDASKIVGVKSDESGFEHVVAGYTNTQIDLALSGKTSPSDVDAKLADNFTQADSKYIATDQIKARDSGGLKLNDDGGNGPLIADSGLMTNLSQPCFAVYISAGASNVTGDGTSYAITTGNTWAETVDNRGDFSNGVFTAPAIGVYLLTGYIELIGINTATVTHYDAMLVTSNATFAFNRFHFLSPGSGVLRMGFSILAEMETGDTAYLQTVVTGSIKGIDIGTCHFQGVLIC